MKIFTVLVFPLALLLSCASASAELVIFGTGGNQFTMEFVPIGNPGNAADTTGLPNPAGSVGNTYNMGKYEVSRDMVTKASAAGGLGLTLFDMSSFGGNGVDRPATGLNWNQAARFVNWLNTSQGFQAAYKFSEQPGEAGYSANSPNLLWTSGDAGFDAANLFRNSLAHYFLPSVDEWYKAAYYDPNANGGAGGYWNFPTGSDTAPTAVASGATPGTAVYVQPGSQGPADITEAGGLSPYGIMGLGGNAYEMEQTESDLTNDNSLFRRGVRGGNWDSPLNPNFLSASLRAEIVVTDVNHVVGFRVASVPEPSSLLYCGVVAMGLVCWKWLAS
jgi:formylglycine-generating enzyme required for sulfatase activity